ncbi:hypothetical protein M407DRAFT_196101 [Tulasnella calospora MUT 4182]|uniref:Uncharacterized protein n=1 Tax=Tulasnella calospora MUT 4182 TaxID=1051891 RepID=A0A0C3KZS7_9AGAM|nr:hypothetical protein M407DRAFT_123286 [Tulasnella calospora MUT 4182]KIO26873.1 hypothetical protein M407DRAFT_196101 [Tulasnella calospora MUT 4182]
MVLYQRFTLRNLPTLASSDWSATSQPPGRKTAGDWNGFPSQDRRSLIRRFGGYSASFQQF